jgi:hypothetical protein
MKVVYTRGRGVTPAHWVNVLLTHSSLQLRTARPVHVQSLTNLIVLLPSFTINLFIASVMSFVLETSESKRLQRALLLPQA